MRKYLYQDLYELEEKHWWHLSKRQELIGLVKWLKLKNTNILEIGCGTGKNLEVLSKFGETWGLDNSKEAIKFCKRRGLNNLVLGDAENIPFSKGKFNLIILLDVLEHTDDIKSIKEISRVLAPKGYLIITVPAFFWLWSQWDVVLEHKRRYKKHELISKLELRGFKIVKISYVCSFLVLPALVIRFIKSRIFKKEYPSDFKLGGSLSNWLFLQLCNIERITRSKIELPFGTSIICLAQKENLIEPT